MNRRARLAEVLFLLLMSAAPLGAQQRGASAPAPAVDDLISLKRASAPSISPDGRSVAYTVRETNWEDNSYETEIWLADAASGARRQLTNAVKSSNNPAWSPDSSRLAFLSDRAGKRQIYVINPQGGEAVKLTASEEGVSALAWSPDGKYLAYTQTDAQPESSKEREKRYGEFDVVDQDYRMTHIYVVDVASQETRRLTKGAFTVGRFEWSPDSTRIAFDHRVNTDPASGGTADISIVNVATGVTTPLVTGQGPDANPVWSPDGSEIAFESALANRSTSTRTRTSRRYAQRAGPSRIFRPASTRTPPSSSGRRAAFSSRRRREPGAISSASTRRPGKPRDTAPARSGSARCSVSAATRRPSPSWPATR